MLKVLIKIDEKTYKGGKNNDNHPMAWYHEYDGGRAFYTELGHTDESYKEDNYLKHLLEEFNMRSAIIRSWIMQKRKPLIVPEEDRFTKTILTEGTFLSQLK